MFDWSSVQREWAKAGGHPRNGWKFFSFSEWWAAWQPQPFSVGFFFPKYLAWSSQVGRQWKLFSFFLFSKSAVAQLVHLKKWPTELKRKKMTSEDLAERSTKSLCFRCNEKCGHRHVCKTLFMMRRRNGDRKIRRRSKRTISSSNFTPRMILLVLELQRPWGYMKVYITNQWSFLSIPIAHTILLATKQLARIQIRNQDGKLEVMVASGEKLVILE